MAKTEIDGNDKKAYIATDHPLTVGCIAGMHSVYGNTLYTGVVKKVDKEEVTISFEGGWHVQSYPKKHITCYKKVKN